jgi:hypothetical protein
MIIPKLIQSLSPIFHTGLETVIGWLMTFIESIEMAFKRSETVLFEKELLNT